MDGRVNRPAAFALSPALPPQKVVLQVDASRQIDYRRWLLLGLLLLAAALFNGSQRSAPLSHGYRVVQTPARCAPRRRRIGRRLRAEIASLESPALIERLAREQLRMVLPGPDDQIVLQLVVPPPAAALVRRRVTLGGAMAEHSEPRSWRQTAGPRLLIVGVLLSVWAVAVFVRLVDLQILQHDALEARGKRQQTRMVKVPAQRGDIVDRHGKPLAYTVEEDTLGVDPTQAREPAAVGRAAL